VGKVNAKNGSAPINLPQKNPMLAIGLLYKSLYISSSCLLQVSSSAMEELARFCIRIFPPFKG